MKVHLMRMELDSIENFVISMEGQKKASKNQRDIIIENFCISAYKKKLFNKARLQIMSKRRYGLVGPNGTGKSTILLLLEARKFEIPENMDIHLV